MSKNVEKSKGARGQTIGRSFGRDDSSYPVDDGQAKNGKEMGGSTTNLGHSLSGASAVQRGTGSK